MVRNADMITKHMNLAQIGSLEAEPNGTNMSRSFSYWDLKAAAGSIGFDEISQQEACADVIRRYSYGDERMRTNLGQKLSAKDPNFLQATADFSASDTFQIHRCIQWKQEK